VLLPKARLPKPVYSFPKMWLVQLTPSVELKSVSLSARKMPTVSVLETQTGLPLTATLEHPKRILDARFDPDGRRILTCSEDGKAWICDILTGKPLLPPLEHPGPVKQGSFSSDGKRILTVCVDATVRVWNAASGEAVTPRLPHSQVIANACFAQGGEQVIVVGKEGIVKVWQVSQREFAPLALGAHDQVAHLALTPDRQRVLTMVGKDLAQVCDIPDGGKAVGPLAHTNEILDATFSADGRWIAIAGKDSIVKVWDSRNGTMRLPDLYHGASNRMGRVHFSADGSRLFTTARPTYVDTRSGRVVVMQGPITLGEWSLDATNIAPKQMTLTNSTGFVEFSPDGKMVITALEPGGNQAPRKAQIWDTATGMPAVKHLAAVSWVGLAQFSPDSQFVAVGDGDRTLSHRGSATVWKTSGEPVGRLPWHKAAVLVVAFSPDSRRLATGTSGGIGRIWNVLTGEPVTPELSRQNVLRLA
jgi:WD40 repeat protein